MQIQEVIDSIDKLLLKKETVTVTIEGSSASGKTTLSNELKKYYGCTVFHMDDFFLRPEQRTQERLMEPGGNVDRERFYEEIVLPLNKGKEIVYKPFDCATFTLQQAIKIKPEKLVVIEGAYSTHPELGKYYDLSVFLDITPELQRERILKRNAGDKAERFFSEWIPMEQKYFEVMKVKERCTLILPIV